MLEYVNIRQSGYGARREFDNFTNRYFNLKPNTPFNQVPAGILIMNIIH